MVETNNSAPSVEDFQNAFPDAASEDSLAKAMMATRLFSQGGPTEEEILQSVYTDKIPDTRALWSEQEAREKRTLLYASVTKYIANSSNTDFIIQNDDLNDTFNQEVLSPIRNWQVNEDGSDKEKILEMKKDIEQTVSGVLWTLYSDELKGAKGYSNEYEFAKRIFFDRRYVIRPNSYNRGLISEYKQKVLQSK